MARSAIFFLLFLATNASLALLYPFTLSRFLLVALDLRRWHGGHALLAVSSAQPMAGCEPLAGGWCRLCGPDLRRRSRPRRHAQVAGHAPGEKCEGNILCGWEACGTVSGNRAPRLGRRAPSRKPHLVAPPSVLFSHARASTGRDRARHGEHLPYLWFPAAFFPLACWPASSAFGALSQGCGTGVCFLEHSDV